MKKIAAVSLKGLLLSALLCVALFCAALFTACNKAETPALDSDTSYSFGMLVAAQMGFTEISFDYKAFMEGFRDFNEDSDVRLTQEQAMEKVLTALATIEAQDEEEQKSLAEVNLEEGNNDLAENAQSPAKNAQDSDTSYSFGMLVAAQMGFTGINFDYKALMEGFRDFNEDSDMRLTQEQAMEKILAALATIEAQDEEEQKRLAEVNLEEGKKYLAKNARRPGVVTTESGLQYEVIVQGSGAQPSATDTVLVHYEGTFVDGTVFDSSFQRGEPAQFPVGAVIQGWIEGIQLMNAGSTYRFVIPSDLAYGPQGARSIPPDKTLIFNVELLDIVQIEEGQQ